MRIYSLCLLFFSLILSAQNQTQLQSAKVDPRVELLSIAFRLAEAQEFSSPVFESYVADINKHFEPNRTHELIHFIQKIRKEQGIGYDAVACMAMHISYPDLTPIVPFSGEIPEKRWMKNPENTNRFLELLRDFKTVSKFDEFFLSHQDLYKAAESRFNKNILHEIDLDWYEKFYGKVPNETFNIILGMGFTGNFGIKLKEEGKKDLVYSILGTWKIDPSGIPVYTTKNGYLETVVHEFNHSFINYLFDSREALFESAGKPLFELVKNDMSKQAYNNWLTAVNEGMVRAAVVSYFTSSKKADIYAKNFQLQDEIYHNKFYWVKQLVEALNRYEQNREQFPTLETFMPELLKVHRNVSKNPLKYYTENINWAFSLPTSNNENAPKITHFYPENDSQKNPLEIQEIVIYFDREIQEKYNFTLPPFPYKTPPLEKIYLADNKKEIRIRLKRNLDPNTEYGLGVGSRFFSLDSVAMNQSVLYHFATITAKKDVKTIEKNKSDFRFKFSINDNRILSDLNGKPVSLLEPFLKENNIQSVKLVGDFNQWNYLDENTFLSKNEKGEYEILLPKNRFRKNSLFTFLINDEYLVQPNCYDSNTEFQPNYHYFKIVN